MAIMGLGEIKLRERRIIPIAIMILGILINIIIGKANLAELKRIVSNFRTSQLWGNDKEPEVYRPNQLFTQLNDEKSFLIIEISKAKHISRIEAICTLR